MQSLVYFVVIFLAFLFAFFAMMAMAPVQSVVGVDISGGCGMLTCRWFRMRFRVGCVCQRGSCCTMYMVLLIR